MVSNDILIIKEENVNEKAANIKEELKNSQEVLRLAANINIKDANSVLEFGNQPAEKISKFADQILNSIKSSSVENSGVMIRELTTIMKNLIGKTLRINLRDSLVSY